MQIARLDPDGIQPRESLGIGTLEEQLPSQWFGFANLMMRSGGREQPREIDLVFVTHDRIFIVDLKDWGGIVESREGVWYQNERQRERSAAAKLSMNARRLKTLLENEARELGDVPWIEHFVVFTNPTCDFSGLEPADFANNVVSLPEFTKLLRSKDAYDRRFRRSETWARFRPLTEGNPQQILRRFFRGPERFTPREVIFDHYRPVGDPVFEHPRGVYQEFICDHVDNPNYQALLRYWDFEALPTQASVAADRKSIAGREHAVLGYLLKVDPQLYDDAVMQSQSRDNDFQMHYWELFQLRRTMRRINEYLVKRTPDLDRRFAISSMLISRVAQLHRDTVAHRDLGSHSVWYDERQSRVILSAFGAAHFPERHTIGDLRLRLIAATSRLPEDIEESGVKRGTPFQQDVFLLGALVWEIVSGKAVEATGEGVVDWTAAQFDAIHGLPDGLRVFFAKALSWEPPERFDSAVTMHDAFVAAIRRNEPDFHISLDAYERDTPPFLLYPATASLSAGRSTAWIAGAGDTRVAVKLWTITSQRELSTRMELSRFLQTADDIKSHRPVWTPEVVDYGVWNNNLYIVTRFVEAEPLEGRYSAVADTDSAYEFCLGLITAISELHSARQTHGDVSPSNILVERRSDGTIMPLLIDMPDFAAPEEGELTTSAYAPQRYADAYTRDRFGVAKIVSEILFAAGAEASDDTRESRLLSAALRCTDGQDAGLTMRPMLAAIEENKRREELPSAVMRVGVRNLSDERQFLGNDGLFSVVLDESAATMYVVGLDEQLEIRVSRDSLTPFSTLVRPASVGTLNWAESERILTFESIVCLYPALHTDAADLGWLWARPEISTQLSTLRTGSAVAPNDDIIHHVPVHEVISAPPLQAEAARPVVDVSKLWLATIEVEDEELVELHVTGRPSWDPAHRVHVVPCDFSSTDLDLDARQSTSVVFNGRIIGDVDVDLMTSTELPIRGMRDHVRLYAGARLMLQSRQDWDNLSRRRRAVKRVVDNEAVIHRLLDYFKIDAEMQPLSFPDATPTARDLDRYELSSTQREAFEKLWALGPVGLLQGPPGTGKTRFIASFVHYALTEGGMHNALLLSQSHEAVNNAAESLLKIFGADAEPLSLLRIGQVSKVSEALVPFQSEAVQDHYRELFLSEVKDRVAVVGTELGLPTAFSHDVFEADQRLRHFESMLRTSVDASREGDIEESLRSIAKQGLAELLTEFGVERDASVEVASEQIEVALAQRHGVINKDARRRFRRAHALALEWVSALAGQRTLEQFLARSRSVVSGTCVGIGRRALRIDEVQFDLVVIDEAAKCTPGELAVGMQVGRRVVLVGDQRQLPPYGKREHLVALRKRFSGNDAAVEQTDFERAFLTSYGQNVGVRLTTQFRMAPTIGELVSSCFYSGEIETGRGVPPNYYNLLPEPLRDEVSWIDTSEMGSVATESLDGTSRSNLGEAYVIIRLLRLLSQQDEFWSAYDAAGGHNELAVGVICMYSAQKDVLDRLIVSQGLPSGFLARVKIDTVDSYQGKQNPIVIVSLVRNNEQRQLGHVEDLRRVNVALSRAMERLVLVGAARFFETEWAENPLSLVLSHMRSTPALASRIFAAKSVQAESRVAGNV